MNYDSNHVVSGTSPSPSKKSLFKLNSTGDSCRDRTVPLVLCAVILDLGFGLRTWTWTCARADDSSLDVLRKYKLTC